MSGISTHILDTAAGKPVAGVAVRLYCEGRQAGEGITNQDGRCAALNAEPLQAGIYRLVFDVDTSFYPVIEIQFRVADPAAHYHIPLLLSPFGYTTYRGS